jgi:hypothetical protein
VVLSSHFLAVVVVPSLHLQELVVVPSLLLLVMWMFLFSSWSLDF